MEYLNRDELVRLLKVARQHNSLHHVAMLVGLLHGLRVSETLAIRGRDICDGRLAVRRLKKIRPTLHALRIDGDPFIRRVSTAEVMAVKVMAVKADQRSSTSLPVTNGFGLAGLAALRLLFPRCRPNIRGMESPRCLRAAQFLRIS